MKRLIYILFLVLLALPLHAQSEETSRILSYIQKAMNFNKVVPQEKVYLHFDNMGYFENETLWFKAYATRTGTGHSWARRWQRATCSPSRTCPVGACMCSVTRPRGMSSESSRMRKVNRCGGRIR